MKIKSYLINLKKDVERLNFMEKQLENIGLQFDRFDAVNPSDLEGISKFYIEEQAINKFGKGLTKGEVGCTLSHLFIYEDIVKNKRPISIILEDDGIIGKNFLDLYSKIELQKKYNFDYLTFSYTSFDLFGIKDFVKVIKFNSKKSYRDFFIEFFIKFPGMLIIAFFESILFYVSKKRKFLILKTYRNLYLTSGYFITYEGAKKILSTTNGMAIYPSDIMQNISKKEDDLRIYFTSPSLVKQNLSFESNIEHIKL